MRGVAHGHVSSKLLCCWPWLSLLQYFIQIWVLFLAVIDTSTHDTSRPNSLHRVIKVMSIAVSEDKPAFYTFLYTKFVFAQSTHTGILTARSRFVLRFLHNRIQSSDVRLQCSFFFGGGGAFYVFVWLLPTWRQRLSGTQRTLANIKEVRLENDVNRWINRTLLEAITFVPGFNVREHCHVESFPKTEVPIKVRLHMWKKGSMCSFLWKRKLHVTWWCHSAAH